MKYFQSRRFLFMSVLILTIVNLKIIVAGDVKESDGNEKREICGIEKCTKEGSQAYWNVKTFVDPCENFFRYTCDTWKNENAILDDVTAMTQRDLLEINKLKQLHGWFNEMTKENEPSNSQTLRKVVDYYRSCMNLAAVEAQGFETLKKIVEMNGGWPVNRPVREWSITESNLSLQKILENYLEHLEVSALFEFNVRPFNNGEHLLHFVPPKQLYVQPEGPRYLFATRRIKRETLDAEAEYVKRMAKIFVTAEERGVMRESRILKMISFKRSLSELYSNPTKNGQEYAKQTIAQIQDTWNREIGNRSEYAINWLKIIRSAFKGTNITIEKEDQVVLRPRNIIGKLAKILTDNRLETVVNYVHWAVISERAIYTNKKMREIVDDSAINPYGHRDIDDRRSYTCVEQHKMHVGLSYAYAKRFFSGDHRTHVRDIVSSIKDEIVKLVGPEVMEQSKNKVEMLMKNIGYPSWYDDDGKMDDYHRELVVKPDAYFENVISYDRFRRKKSLKKLRQPYDKREARSKIVPEGLEAMNFQKSFSNPDRTSTMEYGAIGGLTGHELARAFINRTTITNGRYRDESLCFVENYNKRTLYRNKQTIWLVNGEKTLVQNIADYTGFTAALRAFVTHKKKNNVRKRHDPPSVRHPDDRLFFYSLAERFCESLSAEYRAALAMDENIERSPNEVRINGAFSNIQQFSDAFQCEPGSPMNPVKKCQFWN